MNPAPLSEEKELNPAPFTLKYPFVAERCGVNSKRCRMNIAKGAG